MGGCSSSYDNISMTSSPTKIPFEFQNSKVQYKQNDSEEMGQQLFSDLVNMFDQVDQSEQNQNEFYTLMANRFGQLYAKILTKIQEKMLKDEYAAQDLKVHFSKTILLEIMNMVSRLQKSKNWNSEKTEIFRNITDKQRKIIQFLKFKYPRNKKAFVPTELDETFQGMDDSEHTDNDILINSGIHFDVEEVENFGKFYIVKQIKKFYNVIIDETNKQYEGFRINMENIFEGLDGSFKIGRKIPENIGKYKDLDTENFHIHSPEIFRIMIKWIGSMDGVFLRTVKDVNKMKYFKITEQNDEQFTYFPLYTNKSEITHLLLTELEEGSKSYMDQLENHQNLLANFNDNIIKLLSKKSNIPEINHNEIKTIKYSSYISKFIEFLATDKLVYLLTELCMLRKKMDNKIRKGIDLINCNLTDLMRAQYMGNKNDLMAIHKKLIDMQGEGKIKFVRIKNRFDTPLNDALVNFKFKDSFIVCQLQLILKKATQSSGNSKQKVHETVNHVLYQLERSIFGPMAQMSLLLNHNDTRMGYENKIKLNVQTLKKLRCPEKLILTSQNDLAIPYVCSLCSNFYPINQNSFPIHRCQSCNFYVCPACLFKFDPDIELQCYQKQLFNYIKQNWLQNMEETEDFDFFFFDKKYYKASAMTKGKNLFDSLEQMMIESEIKYVFLMKFSQGRKFIKGYSVASGSILPIYYQYLPRQERKVFKNQKIGQFDIILFLKKKHITIVNKPFKQIMLSPVYLVKIDDIHDKKINQVQIFKYDKNIFVIDLGEIPRGSENTDPKIAAQKNKEVEKILSKYKPMEGKLQLDYLDLNHLDFSDKNIKNIRFAKLSNNHLRDISVILESASLQQVDVSRNDLAQIEINHQLPKLRILDMSENYIQTVKNFDNKLLPNLKEIKLKSNRLTKFPQFHLKNLLWLNLDNNKISSIDELRKDALPKIRRLHINKNQIESMPEIELNELKDFQMQQNNLKDMSFIKLWRKLQNLSLQNNEISELPILNFANMSQMHLANNKIENVDSLKKSNLPCLLKIDISENQIASIPVLELDCVEYINFSSNMITDIQSLSKSDMPFLKEMNFSHNQISKMSIFTFQELRKLDFSYNKIKSISDIIHSEIPNINTILLSNNEITQLLSIKFQHLITLNLESNQISSFEHFRDSEIPKLKILKLADNKITKFLSADFPGLEQLYLQGNDINIFQEIKQQHLRVLKVFNLENNKLQVLPSVHLESLEKFYLSQNQISNLQQFKNSILPQLSTLDLKKNKIKDFPGMKCDSITLLDLSFNELNTLQGLSDCEFSGLQELVLSNNKLTNLTALQFPKLYELNMDNNNLSDVSKLEDFVVPEISIINLKNNKIQYLGRLQSQSLNELQCSSNQIRQIEGFSKSNLPKLNIINLNNNQIAGTLPRFNFPSLKRLDLSKNSIYSLKQFSKSSLPKLDVLRLSHNKIEVLPEFEDNLMVKLKDLLISHNAITDIEDFCKFSTLPKLEKLFLGNNKIQHLPPFQFKTLQNLNLQHNLIEDLQDFSESELASLESLNLKGNKIKRWLQSIQLQSLEKLILSENELTSFSQINSNSVYELKQLNLRKNKITSLPQNPDLPNIVKINLQGNVITKGLKEFTSKIKENSLHSNLKLNLDKAHSLSQNLMNMVKRQSSKQSSQTKLEKLKLQPHNSIGGAVIEQGQEAQELQQDLEKQKGQECQETSEKQGNERSENKE